MSGTVTLRNRQYLEEMGLGPVWVLRDRPAADEPPAAAGLAEIDDDAHDAQRSAAAAFASDSGDRLAATGSAGDRPTARASGLPAGSREQAWAALRSTVANCQACGLCRQRKQAVLGVGDLQPDLLVIGEGPGAEEDQRGEPFVGQAGRLLDAMLGSIGLARGHKVYIANAVKCRPPGNRTPEPAEMAACRPYLEEQIALLQPKVILLLGRAAAHSVLKDDRALAALRGRPFAYDETPVLVTYHPAYLLRNLPDKAKAWEDLCRVRATLAGRAG